MSAQQLLQKSVFTAYLQPLLTKHEAKKPITYEDLTASWQASMAAIAKAREDSSTKPHVSAVVRRLSYYYRASQQQYDLVAVHHHLI